MPLTVEEKQNIAGGFKAAGERIDSLEAGVNTSLKEIQESIGKLENQLRRYGRAVLSGLTDDGQEYRGFWGSEDKAKAFGELILKALHRKAMGESVSSESGVLVPTDMASWIIQKIGIYGKFRKYALNVRMGRDRQIVPKVETSLTVYAPGEGAKITASDMEFSQVGLAARKLACLCKVSSELEEDALIGLAEIVGISMARSIAKKEDLIGFLGDGTSTYFGMTGIIGALLAVDADPSNIAGLVVASGNLYSEITLGDFRKVVGILPGDFDDTARWYMNKKFYFNVVYPLAETAGVANIFEILSDRKSKYLLGYPVEFISAMPNTEANSQVCALLGDLEMGAYLGERRELTIARSDDIFFANDQIGFRGTERIDVSVFGVGDTSEPGPIVGLITAAS